MQQNIFAIPVKVPPPLATQQVYFEMMSRRKALYLLPAFDISVFDMVDGSGAFNLNMLLLPLSGATGPIPTTVAAMRRAQGVSLRNWLLPITRP